MPTTTLDCFSRHTSGGVQIERHAVLSPAILPVQASARRCHIRFCPKRSNQLLHPKRETQVGRAKLNLSLWSNISVCVHKPLKQTQSLGFRCPQILPRNVLVSQKIHALQNWGDSKYPKRVVCFPVGSPVSKTFNLSPCPRSVVIACRDRGVSGCPIAKPYPQHIGVNRQHCKRAFNRPRMFD